MSGLLLAFGAACLALGFMVGFLAGTTELRAIRRELEAIKRRVRPLEPVTDGAALVLLREQLDRTLEQMQAVQAGTNELVELLRRPERGTAELHAELRRARRDLERRLDQREPPALERC